VFVMFSLEHYSLEISLLLGSHGEKQVLRRYFGRNNLPLAAFPQRFISYQPIAACRVNAVLLS